MNGDVLQGKWKQIRGKVKEEWGHIADQDLVKIGGQREQLVGLVQEKYGYTKVKAEQDVDYILNKLNIRTANGIHVSSLLAGIIGSLLTLALYRALARRLASA